MPKRVIIPAELQAAAARVNMSPAVIAGDMIFLTGLTGLGADGQMPDEAEEQFRNVFEKVRLVLAAGDLTLGAIVEMTTYHIGLRETFDVFDGVRLEYLSAPYPAWTAVEVAGLRRPGAIVEMRVIASLQADD